MTTMEPNLMVGESLTKCPRYAAFDPLQPAQIIDPYPILARAREEAPIFYMDKHDLWVVTRREDVLAIYKDMAAFSNGPAQQPLTPKTQAVIERVGEAYGLPVDGSINALDPPVHLPLKRLVVSVFQKALSGMDNWLETRLEKLVDQFADVGEVDLVPSFNWPVTVGTVAHLIGASDDEANRFKEWAENWFELVGSSQLSNERAEACWMGFVDFENWAYRCLEDRRKQPREDLMSKLLNAQREGANITDREIVTNCIGMVAAGTDTTANSIGQMMYMLLSNPDQLKRVRDNSDLRPRVIEEVLRLRVPVRGVIKITTRDIELGGVTLPKGAKIYVHIGSANRDAAMFEHGDQFDIERPNARKHLAFGAFNRACVGAPLARMEMTKALDVLLRRLPGLRFASDHHPLRYTESIIVPSLRSLRVAWDVVARSTGV